MNLRDLLRSMSADQKREFAAAIGVSADYLPLLSGGHRNPSPALARRCVEVDSRLTLHELRPDIWDADTAADAPPRPAGTEGRPAA
jgi:hypothetical protein